MCRCVIGNVRLNCLEPVTGLVHLEPTLFRELDLIEVNLQSARTFRVSDFDLRLFVLNLELVVIMFTLGVVEVYVRRLGLCCHCFILYEIKKN